MSGGQKRVSAAKPISLKKGYVYYPSEKIGVSLKWSDVISWVLSLLEVVDVGLYGEGGCAILPK